jgi:ankyrin repeat protein
MSNNNNNIESFLKKQKEFEKMGYDKMTPAQLSTVFLIAVSNNDKDLAYYLMEQHEVKLDSVTTTGNTAYHIAAQRNYEALMSDLVDRHDDELSEEILNMRNKRGRTAAYEAAVRGNIEIVKMLWERGADLDDIFDDSGDAAGFDWRQNKELKKIFWHYSSNDHFEAGRKFWEGVFNEGSNEAKMVERMSNNNNNNNNNNHNGGGRRKKSRKINRKKSRKVYRKKSRKVSRRH